MHLKNILNEAKKRFQEGNVTVKEISENTGVDETLIILFLDDRNGIIDALSKIIEFSKIRIRVQELKFITYKITNETNQYIRVKRSIQPMASMFYNKATGGFYNFKWGSKGIAREMTKERKEVIANEMAEFVISTVSIKK